MADISKIKVPINGTATTYNVKDTTARTHISDTTVHVTAADKTNWNAKSELALGETSSTAYRGDRGKTAYTHATDSSRLTNATNAGLYKVGCTAEGHISALTAVEKADITALGIPASDTNTIPSAYCGTAAATAAKTASCTDYTLTSKTYLHVLIKTANSSAGKITLNVNGKGAKDIWINGAVSSASNYTLPAGSYITYYDGSKYLFRTDGKLVTSDLIGEMTGYSKPSSTSAIAATDTLNAAIGKLEKGLDGKGTSNLTLGTASTNAYYGDKGNTAYTHATETRLTTATAAGLYKVGSTAQGHISALTAITKADITGLGIPESDTNNRKAFYGTTDTAAGTATKVVTLGDTTGWELKAGTIVGVYFAETNTAGSVKLNVNGSGANSVSFYNNAAYTGKNANITGRASYITYYMFTGTYWLYITCTYNYGDFLPTSGGTVSGNVNIRKDSVQTDPATDEPAILQLQARYTPTGGSQITSSAFLRAYSDHAGYGANLVVQSGGNLFIGSGEAPNSHYNLYPNNGSEITYITADNVINIQAGGNAIANRRGLKILTDGSIVPCVADVAVSAGCSLGTSNYAWNDIYCYDLYSAGFIYSNHLYSYDGNVHLNVRKKSGYIATNWGNPIATSADSSGHNLSIKVEDFDELLFYISLPNNSRELSVTVPSWQIMAEDDATNNPSNYQEICQGYYSSTSDFASFKIRLWNRTSTGYVYYKVVNVVQNNTTNVVTSSSCRVYYR